jgi:hypothetical protein
MYVPVMYLFWQKWLGYILGDFFHKLIWSPCPQVSAQSWLNGIPIQKLGRSSTTDLCLSNGTYINASYLPKCNNNRLLLQHLFEQNLSNWRYANAYIHRLHVTSILEFTFFYRHFDTNILLPTLCLHSNILSTFQQFVYIPTFCLHSNILSTFQHFV